jgi:hypothetical protein
MVIRFGSCQGELVRWGGGWLFIAYDLVKEN